MLVGDRSVTYGILSPKAVAPAGGRPLVVALHYGTATEPGLSPYVGLGFAGLLVLPALEALDAVIVAPDAPELSWAHPASEEVVLAVIEAARKAHAIDTTRTLVTGFSMGGQGTWYLAARHPELFKAAIPMAAQPLVRPVRTAADVRAQHAALAQSTDWAQAVTRTPLYVVASRADTSVPFDAVEHAARAVETAGGRVRFAPVDHVPHQMVTQFVPALAGAVPWVREVWGA